MKTVRNCRITTLIGLCCTSITCSMLGIQTVQASTTVQGNGAASGAGAVGRIPSVSPGPSSSPSNTPTPSNGSQASVSGQLTLTAAASPTSTPSSSPGTTGSSEPTSTASSPSKASSHTVTFDCNMQSAAPTTSTVADGAQVARPSPEPTRRGFVLEGWFAGKVAYDFSAPVHSDLTLKAKVGPGRPDLDRAAAGGDPNQEAPGWHLPRPRPPVSVSARSAQASGPRWPWVRMATSKPGAPTATKRAAEMTATAYASTGPTPSRDSTKPQNHSRADQTGLPNGSGRCRHCMAMGKQPLPPVGPVGRCGRRQI